LAFDHSVFFEIEGAKEVGVEFHSLSKTFNMTGWRIGFAVGGSEIISVLGRVKTNIDSGVFQAIQEAGTVASPSASRRLAGRVLVVSELAMAVILLAGAGLMLNSVIRLLNVDPGFDPANLAKITMWIRTEHGGDPRADCHGHRGL
jgi:hypothetical protein